MARFSFSDFSFTPLVATLPGFTMLAAFATDKSISVNEALMSVGVIALGALWAGLKQSHAFPEPVTRVDTTLASVILDALPDPVLLLDKRRRVVAANRAADDLLGSGVHGRDICLILRQLEAQNAIRGAVAGQIKRGDADLVFEVPVRRNYELQVMAVPSSAALSVRAVVALHEVTALKTAETMRTDFVANVSHELRSPLSSLTGFIETLQTSALDDVEAQQRFLPIMQGEAGRMARLIDDLLSLSKIEGKEHIRPTGTVDIQALIGDVIATVQLKADKKSMSIDNLLTDEVPLVVGDGDQLREVFQNLVENAIKYGQEGTPVTIAVRPVEHLPESGGKGVEISVSDRGEGIPAEHIPRLTERFYRIDKGRSRAMGGTGLGLAIVKHIVNRHRGRLIVTSTEGEGSTFAIQLPISTS